MLQGKSTMDIVEQRKSVQQLRQELEIKRMRISVTANELMQFCIQHEAEDRLLNPKSSDNPFQPKKTLPCAVLWSSGSGGGMSRRCNVKLEKRKAILELRRSVTYWQELARDSRMQSFDLTWHWTLLWEEKYLSKSVIFSLEDLGFIQSTSACCVDIRSRSFSWHFSSSGASRQLVFQVKWTRPHLSRHTSSFVLLTQHFTREMLFSSLQGCSTDGRESFFILASLGFNRTQENSTGVNINCEMSVSMSSVAFFGFYCLYQMLRRFKYFLNEFCGMNKS